MPKPVIAAINGAAAGRGPLARARLRRPLHGRGRRAHDGVLEHRARARLRRLLAPAAHRRLRAGLRARRHRPPRRAPPRRSSSGSCSACCRATSCCRPRTRPRRRARGAPDAGARLDEAPACARPSSGSLADVMELEAQLQAAAVAAQRSRGGRRRVPREARGALRGTLTSVPRPRLRLIVNPVASSVRERTVRTALRALEPHCDVELVETQRHEHAIELAAEAVALGFDGVGAMGGDGTANEVLNGAGDRPPGRRAARPAGRACCRARCGMPRDIGAAAGAVGAALAAGPRAAASTSASSTAGASRSPRASAPTRRPCASSTSAGGPRGGGPGDAYFAAQIMRTLLRGEFREPQLEVSMDGEVVARGGSIFAANVHPWSYVGPFALKLAPLATFEGGLDVVVPSDMRRRHLPRYATQLLVTGSQAYRTDQPARLPARRRRRARGVQPAAAAARRRRRSRRRRGGRLRRRPRRRADPRVSAAAAVRPRRHARRFARRRRAALGRASCERHGLDFAAVLAVLHGVRSADMIRVVAPHARCRRPRRRCWMPAEEVDTDGLVPVRGAHEAARRACRAASWGIVTSGHRSLARAAAARRRPAGPAGDGVRRRGRARQARPRGLPRGRAAARRRARGRASRSRTRRPASQAARAAGMAVVGITTTHRGRRSAGRRRRDRRSHAGSTPPSRPSAGRSRRARTRDAGRLRPRMDLAITIGQGLGFGVACGLSTIALLVPLFWPGIDARALGALGASGPRRSPPSTLWLPQSVRIGAAHRGGRRGLRVLAARRPRLGGPRDRRRRPPR